MICYFIQSVYVWLVVYNLQVYCVLFGIIQAGLVCYSCMSPTTATLLLLLYYLQCFLVFFMQIFGSHFFEIELFMRCILLCNFGLMRKFLNSFRECMNKNNLIIQRMLLIKKNRRNRLNKLLRFGHKQGNNGIHLFLI